MKNKCECCLSLNNLNSLTEDHASLIDSCFSIAVSPICLFDRSSNFICESCVVKIRESSQFRTQILVSQATLKEFYSSTVSNDDLKSKSDELNLNPETDIKEESLSDCEALHDFECSALNKNNISSKYNLDYQKDDSSDQNSKHQLPFEGKILTVQLSRIEKLNFPPIEQIFLSENQMSKRVDDPSNKKNNIASKDNFGRRINQKVQSLKNIFKHERPIEKQLTDIVHNPDNLSIEKNNSTFDSSFSTNLKVDSNMENNKIRMRKQANTKRNKTVSESNAKHKICSEYPFKLNKTATTCELCQETFKSHKLLVSHMAVHYPNYICDICKKPFIRKANLSYHMKMHREMAPCTICNELVKPLSLFRHMENHSKEFTCPHCSGKFPTVRSFHEHLKAVHEADIRTYDCEICAKKFFAPNYLKQHVKRYHLKIFNYSCDVCNRRFFFRHELKQHTKKHSGEKDYECDVCHKKFFDLIFLKSHVNNHHLKNKNFICDICGKGFFDRENFKRHVYVHSDENVFECDFCHKQFKKKHYLKEHMGVHNEVKFKCSYCDTECTYKNTLHRHIRKKHKEVKLNSA